MALNRSTVNGTINYLPSNVDHSLFNKSHDNYFTTLLVYVDDIVLTRTNITEINNVKDILYTKFHIKYLGPLRYFLGLDPHQVYCLINEITHSNY